MKAIIVLTALQLVFVALTFVLFGWPLGVLVSALSFWPHVRHVYRCRRDFGRWFV